MIRKIIIGDLDKSDGPPRNMIFIVGQKVGKYEIVDIVQADPRHYQIFAVHPTNPISVLWKEYINHPVVVEYEIE